MQADILGMIRGDYASSNLKIALFSSNPGTSYTEALEITGQGYSVGGKPMPTAEYGNLEGGGAYLTFSGSVVWENSDLSAEFAAIYNAESARILYLADFGRKVVSVNDSLTVHLPGTSAPLISVKSL